MLLEIVGKSPVPFLPSAEYCNEAGREREENMVYMADDGNRAAKIGRNAEDAVLSLLLSHGFGLIARNYSVCKTGELDLILCRDLCIYIVEVKSRLADNSFGGAREAITKQKKRRMIRTAKVFLLDRKWRAYDVRFIAGCVTHRKDGSIQNIEIVPI